MVYDIIVFGGQSNMQGQSDKLSENEEVRGAFEYKMLTDSYEPLRNPVGEDIKYDGTGGYRYYDHIDAAKWLDDHALGSACYGHTNLVPEFCRAYIKETGRGAAAVHAAKGSTEIECWMKGSRGYEFIVKKTKSAVKALAKIKDASAGDVYFIWLQGESDAIFSKAREDYLKKLLVLDGDLRKDIGLSRFGIIEVGRFTDDRRDDEIINAQKDAAELYPDRFLMLTESAGTMGNEPDMMHPLIGGHFSAKGLERLGREAGTKLGEFVKLNTSGK